MLAEQLTKADRKTEALEQLQLLYARYDGAGRAAEAQATLERIRAIDPTAEGKTGASAKSTKNDDLIFIDLDAPTPRASRMTRGISTKIELTPTPSAAVEIVGSTIEGAAPPDSRPSQSSGAVLGLETTSRFDEAIVEPAPLAASEFAEIDLGAITEEPTAPRVSDLALPGDLPPDACRPRRLGPYRGKRARLVRNVAADDRSRFADDRSERRTCRGHRAKVSRSFRCASEELIELVAEAQEEATTFSDVSAEQIEEPPPPVRRTMSVLANSVGALGVRLVDEPDNWELHRQYAEALLESGDREGGLKELEAALVGFEKGNDLEAARAIAD